MYWDMLIGPVKFIFDTSSFSKEILEEKALEKILAPAKIILKPVFYFVNRHSFNFCLKRKKIFRQ